MEQPVSLFPFVLMRLAGRSYEDLQTMNVVKTMQMIQTLQGAYKEYETIEKEISEELFKVIAATKDDQSRYLLIQIRRDVHNRRPIHPTRHKFFTQLSHDHKKLLKEYIRIFNKITHLENKAALVYTKEKNKSKISFSTLLHNSNFQKGLLLSSNTIIESKNEFLNADINSTKNFTKIERSLLKYLSRMYTKASPFSTFTQVGIAKFSNNTNLISAYPQNRMQSSIQLNNFLYHYLYGLLIQDKDIRNHLSLRPNFTIRKENNQFIFLTNNDNKESFQKMQSAPIVELFYELVLSKEEWVYSELVEKIIQRTHAERAQAEKLLDQFTSLGFIEFTLGMAPADLHWEKTLIKTLDPISRYVPYIKNVIQTLQKLRQLANHYVNASYKKREKIIQEAYFLFRTQCLQLHKAAKLPESELDSFTNPAIKKNNKQEKRTGVFLHSYNTRFPFKEHNLFFEDTFFHQPFALSLKAKKSLNVLGEFLRHMETFDLCLEEKYKIAHFFKSKYGTEKAVDFLQFYREYTAEKARQSNEHTTFPTNQSVIDKRNKNEKLIRTLIKQIEDDLLTDEIAIQHSHIEAFSSGKPVSNVVSSFGDFLQLYEDDRKNVVVVLNNTEPGFGRMFSRFLDRLPPEVLQDMKQQNSRKQSDALYCEITDASAFNGNYHPALMPNALIIPGGQHVLVENYILITDVEVTYNMNTNLLLLAHKQSQKKLFVFDLSFQNPKERSELYWLLSTFTPHEHQSYYPLVNRINDEIKKLKDDKNIVCLPRIVYDNTLILQRKTWQVAKEIIPLKKPHQDDWSYFLQLQTWRTGLDMPEEVFLKCGNEKPQYISFANPLLVELFENLVTKASGEIRIEEMLPSSDELLVMKGKKLVTEFFAQWYF